MEESGISFFFEHAENNHILVMCDGEAAYQPIPGEATVIFHPYTGAVDPRQLTLSQDN